MEVINSSASSLSYLPSSLLSIFTNTFILSILIIICIVILLIYIINNQSSQNIQIGLAILSLLIFLILFVPWFLNIFFNINILTYFSTKKLDVVIDKQVQNEPSPMISNILERKKQVFNIPKNIYTYSDAKALCKAYNAELATYEQIESAYKQGGEWCNYGWSQNQLALYPTQLNTYNNLQKIKGHENDCGRPGINGGYMSNPQLRFGVNCYGYKPMIDADEEKYMKEKQNNLYPKTVQDIQEDNKIKQYENQINQIIISPFNYFKWSNF